MQPGDMSETLRTPKGYQLLELDARTPEECSRPSRCAIRSPTSCSSEARVELKKYLAKMRKEAIIEWKNDELRKAYEAGVAAEAGRRRNAGQPQRRSPDRPPASEREPLVMRGRVRSRHCNDAALVCGMDPQPPRARRVRPAGRARHRCVPADHAALEPLEGSEEEDRVAALPRLLLRPVRSGMPLGGAEMHRRRLDLSFNGELAPVPDEAIDGIRTLVNSALPCDPCPMLKTGMKVEVVHGPLKGVVGGCSGKEPRRAWCCRSISSAAE